MASEHTFCDSPTAQLRGFAAPQIAWDRESLSEVVCASLQLPAVEHANVTAGRPKREGATNGGSGSSNPLIAAKSGTFKPSSRTSQ
jgi:hypothetical protein